MTIPAMAAYALPTPTTPALRDVRCECLVCGAHSMGWLGRTLSASCGNCGSYEMRELSPASPFPIGLPLRRDPAQSRERAARRARRRRRQADAGWSAALTAAISPSAPKGF